MRRPYLQVLIVTALAGAAQAQTARTGGAAANAQMLQQMQQVASERTALQAENEKLKGELADVKKERDSLKAAAGGVERRSKEDAAALSRSNAQREASNQELTQTKAKMQELIGKFRETIAKLRESETDGTSAKQALAVRERELQTCVDHNQGLYRLNDEILTHLENQGAFTRVAQAEPFTKIKRVQLENYVDDSRAHAQDLSVPKPAAIAAPASPAPTPAH
jgi:chromosome segregation ATPase